MINRVVGREISTMVIVGVEPNSVCDYLWATSEGLVGVEKDYEVLEAKECFLDPGGMYFTKIDPMNFEVDGYKFSVQPHKIDSVLSLMETAKERVPGAMRFRQFMYLCVIEQSLFEKLKSKLEELKSTDEYLHAHITVDETLNSLSSHPNIHIQKNAPKGGLDDG